MSVVLRWETKIHYEALFKRKGITLAEKDDNGAALRGSQSQPPDELAKCCLKDDPARGNGRALVHAQEERHLKCCRPKQVLIISVESEEPSSDQCTAFIFVVACVS